MNTTLNAIRSHNPCTEGWKKLLAHLGKTKADDEPLSILTILDSNGMDDALWCLCSVEGRDREIRLYAVWCARQVQHLMSDPRSVAALDVAERYASGAATLGELVAARAAAEDSARAAARAGAATLGELVAARAAAPVSARTAAGGAAWAAARAAAEDSARAALTVAWDAAVSAGGAAWEAAEVAAWDAWAAARDAWYAARDAARDAQERRLREICLQEVSA